MPRIEPSVGAWSERGLGGPDSSLAKESLSESDEHLPSEWGPLAAPCPWPVLSQQEQSFFPATGRILYVCPNKGARAPILDESSFFSCEVSVGPRYMETFPTFLDTVHEF